MLFLLSDSNYSNFDPDDDSDDDKDSDQEMRTKTPPPYQPPVRKKADFKKLVRQIVIQLSI